MIHPKTRGIRGALLLAALSFSPAVFAQESPTGRLALRVFTDRDGLPQNAITSVVFDREGVLWVGTKDGAARYNGRAWTSVAMPPGCPSNWINTALSASDGSVWFGTRGGGVVRLFEGRWSVFSTREGVPSAEILALSESTAITGAPALLVGTADGLARFDGTRFESVALPRDARSTRVYGLFDVKDGPSSALWVGTRDGILRHRGGTWTAFPLSDAPSINPVRGFALTTALDGHPTLVAAVTFTGLLRLDGEEWRKVPLPLSETGAIQAMLPTREKDGAETLWLGAQRQLVRIRGGKVDAFDSRSGFPEDGFWSLAETPTASGDSLLWLGMSGGGLVRWKRDGWTSFTAPGSLKDASVYAVLETEEPDGRSALWVGTNRGGVVRLRGDERTDFSGKGKPGSDSVLSLLETGAKSKDRTIWVGTTAGLAAFSSRGWSFIGPTDGLPGATVNALTLGLEVQGERPIWVGTGDGLGRYEKGRMTNVTAEIQLPDPRVNAVLETAAEDGHPVLWVGTERGLARREKGTTRFITTREGLPADAVLALVEVRENSKRRLFVGTRGGAARLDLDGSDGRFTTFTTQTRPALPNNTVYQVRQDGQQRLYLCTNKGVARLTPRAPTPQDPSEYDVYSFSTEDGLPSAECNTGASAVDSRGRIWVGTIGGAAVLEPTAAVAASPRPLRIERAVLSKSGASLEEGAVLAHDQGHLTFDFALLSFFRDADSLYRTQLKGFDAEPSAWTAEARKEYTSLPEGSYEFNVWGRDVQGGVSGPRRVAFSVRPAPWRTWGAIAAYAALLLLLLSAVVRWRLRAVRRRNEELEQMISARTSELGDAVLRLKESEQNALSAKDAAQQANRAKSTFLASMSHELRTPLNAVIGFAQVLERRDSLRGEDRESVRIIHRSGEHLLNLINDVLSLSKIEAGALALDLKPFDLPGLLESVRAIIRVRAEARGLELRFHLDPDLPRVVKGDEGKLHQVLVNLLGNAVKFTAAGEVSLRVRLVGDRTRFEVEDTGQGITEDDLPKLFVAFAQTESGQRSKEGTGLGLAISRQIVNLMGADIEVRSRVGEGSTFSFEIELPASTEALRARDRRVIGLAPSQGAVKVLVVDDTEENRLLLKRLLVSTGFEVQEASNGRQAVERFETFHPALIFMDVRMPVMDGLEATRHIRDLESRGGLRRCAILALTAGAFEHEREEMLGGGADDFVAKPFRVGIIFEKIEQHLGVTYTYEAQDTGPVERGGLTVIAERLLLLGAERRRELHEALAAGHVRRVRAAVERIRLEDEVLGDALLTEVQAFRLDDLLRLLDRSGERRG
jgi:signal transduction histidine kinase/ligand-binding sensor domain-containing protein/CheY-like chemotaxis protein